MLSPGPDRPAAVPANSPALLSKAELLRALSRLVRGLSAIFWGLPLALLICVKTATREGPDILGLAPPLLATGLICYGLWQLDGFQQRERVWNRVLDRTKLLSLVNLGLSPFTYWWALLPGEPLYAASFGLLVASAVLFLVSLNQLLGRLTAMLPDEMLRAETNLFATMNLYLLGCAAALVTSYLLLTRAESLPLVLLRVVEIAYALRHLILVLLISVPLAITMAMIWKIKEVLLDSVIEAGTTG